ncbi:hypothetical protein FGD67_00725 [Colwellia sp. M166]|uniref:hypothetical protein n=1 Tax=Colwellia sp. M166 TaxID=2583805 RepID=UPI00211E09E2|nr:hypothetical protein [Colwellia sp. M166]UUO21884.1 hypothetical protein FGD67_00725 [Colwellia sp. M166]
MKKALLVLPVALALTGCGSEIDSVKDGIMDFNKTITLGQALDNWKSCNDSNWETFETDNGVTVVQFTCSHKILGFVEKAKGLLSKKEQAQASYFNIASNVQTFQFTLNQDDSFQIDNVQVETTWEDGTKFNDSQKPVEQLETAYNNNFNFDPAQLNKASAAQMAYSFHIIKSRAK